LKLSPVKMGAIVWLPTVACALFGFSGFAIVAAWTCAVTSIADAASACGDPIDPAWAAVECSHGDLQHRKNGLIADHPIRYRASLSQMLTGWGAFFDGVNLLKRFR
jgi:hypothetical protein